MQFQNLSRVEGKIGQMFRDPHISNFVTPTHAVAKIAYCLPFSLAKAQAKAWSSDASPDLSLIISTRAKELRLLSLLLNFPQLPGVLANFVIVSKLFKASNYL